MINKSKAARKQTVTVTIGPQAEEFINAVIAKRAKDKPGEVWTSTGVVGCAAWRGLALMALTYEVPFPVTLRYLAE